MRNTGEEMNGGVREAACPPHQVGKQQSNKGLLMASRKGAGAMRNRNVEGNRGGLEAAHARKAILTRTAKEWGVM